MTAPDALPPAAVEAMDALEYMTTRLPITNEMRLTAALPHLRAQWEGESFPVAAVEWVKSGTFLSSGYKTTTPMTFLEVIGTIGPVGAGDRIVYLRAPTATSGEAP